MVWYRIFIDWYQFNIIQVFTTSSANDGDFWKILVKKMWEIQLYDAKWFEKTKLWYDRIIHLIVYLLNGLFFITRLAQFSSRFSTLLKLKRSGKDRNDNISSITSSGKSSMDCFSKHRILFLWWFVVRFLFILFQLCTKSLLQLYFQMNDCYNINKHHMLKLDIKSR